MASTTSRQQKEFEDPFFRESEERFRKWRQESSRTAENSSPSFPAARRWEETEDPFESVKRESEERFRRWKEESRERDNHPSSGNIPRNNPPPQAGRNQQQFFGMQDNEREFKISIDVKDYKPEELEVKTVDRELVVSGRHEEKGRDGNRSQREFTRSYALPKEVDPVLVRSDLSMDGILTVTAPKKTKPLPGERKIPISTRI